jgi:hypothetical protein
MNHIFCAMPPLSVTPAEAKFSQFKAKIRGYIETKNGQGNAKVESDILIYFRYKDTKRKYSDSAR